MTDIGETIADAALALVGTPFRLHGRDPATGLDCVGLVLCALGAAGVRPALRDDYRVLVRDAEPFRQWAADAGATVLTDAAPTLPGDIIAARPGPLQLHLLVAVSPGYVHAHAGLGRVVLLPDALSWPVWARWRIAKD